MKHLPSTLTDHPSLVGIIRFPGDCYGEKEEVKIPIITNESGKWENVVQTVEMSKTITSISPQSQVYYIPKNEITGKDEDKFTLTEKEVSVRKVWKVSNKLGAYKCFTNKEEALELANLINWEVLRNFDIYEPVQL